MSVMSDGIKTHIFLRITALNHFITLTIGYHCNLNLGMVLCASNLTAIIKCLPLAIDQRIPHDCPKILSYKIPINKIQNIPLEKYCNIHCNKARPLE